MANKKITELTTLTTPDSSDVFPLADISASETKKVAFSDLVAAIFSSLTRGEVVSGSGTSWILAATPVSGTVSVYARGQRLSVTTGYRISGATITTVDSWSAGDIVCDYLHA